MLSDLGLHFLIMIEDGAICDDQGDLHTAFQLLAWL